jgi:hypothetical protein
MMNMKIPLWSLSVLCGLALGCSDDAAGDNNHQSHNKRNPDFELSTTAVQIIEGQSLEVSVRLKEAPTADVELIWQTSDARIGTVSPASMRFTTADWQNPKLLTLTAPQDEVANGERAWRATARIISGDPLYAQLVEPVINAVTQDDDVAGFAITPLTLETRESGQPATFTVRLTSKPRAAVTLALVSDDSSEGDAAPSALIFSPDNWQTPQTVTVVGKDDGEADGDVRYQIVFIAARSDDPAYNGQRPPAVQVTSIDGVCGNGVRDGAEVCDAGAQPDMRCAYGEMSCMVCDARCMQVAGQVVGFCGDGQLQPAAESCDGAQTPSCAQRGATYGQTACTMCQIDEAGCHELDQLALGRAHSCALTDKGQIVCWGANSAGQRTPPAGLPSPVRIIAGADTTCALDTQGGLTCWGAQPLTQAGVAQAGVGQGFVCWLDAAGLPACRGADDAGQATPPMRTFTKLAVGERHACGLEASGLVTCWGDNGQGRATPPAGGVYSEVFAGGRHTCARLMDATLECWGDNTSGQRNVPMGAVFAEVGLGLDFSCGRFMDGSLRCWGRQLLRDATPPGEYDRLSVGAGHACARRTNGEVLCWGDEADGQATPPQRSI